MRTINYKFGSLLPKESQLKLWELVFGCEVEVGLPVCNPLRDDKNPTCFLFESYSGGIILTDFNIRLYFNTINNNSLTLYEALKIKFKLNSNSEVEHFISKMLGNNIIINKDIDESKTINRKTYLSFEPIKVEDKIAYTQRALDYYGTYGIEISDLLKSNAFCVSKYIISKVVNKERVTQLINPINEICIGLKLQDNKCKIYYPERKEFKWFSNTTISNYWFIEGDDRLVITSSHKDALVVNKLTGASVFSPISESVKYTIEQSKLINSFSSIFSLGDGDIAGEAFNERNRQLFNSATIDIIDYNSYYNKYGKLTKDISEIYRLDEKLAREILCNTINS